MPTEPPKSRDALLTTPLGELVGCWAGVQCTTDCNRSSYLPLKLMAAQHGRACLLRDVISRLRCQYCKTPPSATWMVDYPVENGDHGGQTATWRVNLHERVGRMNGSANHETPEWYERGRRECASCGGEQAYMG